MLRGCALTTISSRRPTEPSPTAGRRGRAPVLGKPLLVWVRRWCMVPVPVLGRASARAKIRAVVIEQGAGIS
jgi:hypothetical protein